MTETETTAIIAEALRELDLQFEINESATHISRRIFDRSKRLAFEKGLEIGSVLIAFDPRVYGVDLPPDHREGPTVILRFGMAVMPPIANFTIERDGVAGTLSFDGRPYRCVVPWRAVFGVRSENGGRMLGFWDDSVPADALTKEKPVQKEPVRPVMPTRRGHLRLVPESNDQEPAGDGGAA